MSETLLRALAGGAFALLAAGLSWRLRLGLARELLIASVRAVVQLAAVAAAIALIFEVELLAFAFVAIMVTTASLTAASRLPGLPNPRVRVLLAVGVPPLLATAALVAVGAFDATPRAAVPTAGILIGGAMTATTLAGRRLLEALRDEQPAIEARLCLGDDARSALAPAVRHAIRTGLIPAIDQTRSVGLVTLPGAFVGLVLGGASAQEAATTQLVVLLALLLVEVVAAALLAELIQRSVIAPGERVRPLG